MAVRLYRISLPRRGYPQEVVAEDSWIRVVVFRLANYCMVHDETDGMSYDVSRRADADQTHRPVVWHLRRL